TRAILNEGFYIDNPLDNHITVPFRKWNPAYAEREWAWYESGNPSAVDISKFAPIWRNHMDDEGKVHSNYGHQWRRGDQIGYIVNELSGNPLSRRAVITLYDGKENALYKKDTPCTLNIVFTIGGGRLNMSVLMRSNCLWFGYCNDQY